MLGPLHSLLCSLLMFPLLPQEEPITRIAFGSCFRSSESPGIWAVLEVWEPELLVLLGDNVYADTEDMERMRAAYSALEAIPAFQRLRFGCEFLATWDDHDYGANDAGAEYPMREAAQEVFLDFCREPLESERRRSPGVYDAHILGPPGRRVQVILLDTRYFRSPLERRSETLPAELGRPGRYTPSRDPERTLLGAAQWAWLEEELRKPAELRLIASSIQVVAEDHGYETWANLPLERKRLFELIQETGARDVVFLSGDRHKAELSILDPARAAPDSAVDVGYPVLDLTSSSLNAPSQWWNEINRHRVGGSYHAANFGTLEIEWIEAGPRVRLSIHAADGAVVIAHELEPGS